jgi:hypothetical protein
VPPVDQSQHFAESDIVGGPQQQITALLAAAAFDHALAFQLKKDLFEKFLGDGLPAGDVGNLHGADIVGFRQCRQRSQRIFRLLGNHHKTNQRTLSAQGPPGLTQFMRQFKLMLETR